MTAPVLAVTDPGQAALDNNRRASTFAIHNGFGIEPKKYKKTTDKGSVLAMEGVAVFRTGTFRDSMGYQNTWEAIHLNQMVTNFDYLRNNGTFANVPVRDGHPGWLINGTPGTGKVVGWHTGLSVKSMTAPHDGETYDYLLADYEILDPDAQRDVDSGLWLNRSSEVGGYTTNAEAEHWPVYMGVAYVDIPAVEGLNFAASKTGGQSPRVYVMFDNSKEKDVTAPVLAVPAVTAGVPAVTPQVPAVQAPVQHGAPAASAQPFVFSVNGANTSDFTAVQAHITALEKFQADTQEANRKNFVAALVASNKLPAPKTESYEKFALGLSPAQYTAWTETFDGMEVPALLGQHGGGVANGGQAPAQQAVAASTASELMILTEQVGMHKNAGTPNKVIEKMDSYKRLVALNPSYKL